MNNLLGAKRYILTDKLEDGYWFGRYPTLELARQEAHNCPQAVHILEYKIASLNPLGMVPTGVSYPIKEHTYGKG